MNDTKEAAEAMVLESEHRYTAVIAGGYTGVSAEVFAAYFNQVMVFEPNPKSFELLMKRCTNIPNIIMAEQALGAENGWANLVEDSISWAANTTTRHKQGVLRAVSVVCRQLDTFAFLTVDLLQVDVGGGELDVLKGAEDTIYKHRPVLIVEMGKGGGRDQKATTAWLNARNYFSTGHILDSHDYVFKFKTEQYA